MVYNLKPLFNGGFFFCVKVLNIVSFCDKIYVITVKAVIAVFRKVTT